MKEENCFSSSLSSSASSTLPFLFDNDPENEQCYEKRIFYRLMSGLQSSISTHIAKEYLLSPDKDEWGPNYSLFWNRVGNHPSRLDHLYFTFLFLLRSVMKAKNIFMNYPFDSSNKTNDAMIRGMLKQLYAPITPIQSSTLGLLTSDPLDSMTMAASPYTWPSSVSFGYDVDRKRLNQTALKIRF
jgi:hypothetical protein